MIDHAALIIKNNEKILFIKRSKYKRVLPNLWGFPSGTKEENEDINETAVREAYEELDLKIKVEKLITTKDVQEFNVRLHFLLCSIISGNPIIKDEKEISEMEWLTFQEFFNKYQDHEIGNGVSFLRKNPSLWVNI
ncbi:MAG TPA: NUDIX hydrolase [Candidatus Nanoarchaeia archaeon]|nr:NUDIX hydrolase [Candidatus Nanoarchaeia archaeon]